MTSRRDGPSTPGSRAQGHPEDAASGPQFEYGKSPALCTAKLASMSPAVSQVSRSTRTRLRILRRLVSSRSSWSWPRSRSASSPS